MKDLRNSFTTGGGVIHPGGYVRVRGGNPTLPMAERRTYAEDNGLAIWHPMLVRYGKMSGMAAHVTQRGHLSIRDARGCFLDCVTGDKAISVDVYPGFIACNGYVGDTLGEGQMDFRKTFKEIVAGWERHTCIAIDKANAGDHPGYVDNSPFTKVTGVFTKYQRVTIIKPMMSHKDGEGSMIYDLAGNRFASMTHYPLRVSKWNPSQDTAKYSKSETYIISAT